jgi:hypothetical protein
MLLFVGIIIIRINDILVPHVSNCVGHLQVIVNRNEVMVVYSIYMTVVGDVVCIPYGITYSDIVFLYFCVSCVLVFVFVVFLYWYSF